MWPFGEHEDDAIRAADILEEEYDADVVTDPWWWPLWSNPIKNLGDGEVIDTSVSTNDGAKATVNPNSKNDKVLGDENVASKKSTESEIPATKTKKKRALIRDWVWPF